MLKVNISTTVQQHQETGSYTNEKSLSSFYPLKFIKLYKCTITKQAETYKFNEKRGFSIQ